jgi:hypothetical protein
VTPSSYRLLPDGSVALRFVSGGPETRFACCPASVLETMSPEDRETIRRHHARATRAAIRASWQHFGER